MQEKNKLPRRRMLQLGLGATAGLLTTGLSCNNNTATTGWFFSKIPKEK